MSPHEDDQIAWTTARCHRLLRPISSRLAKLRKDTGISRIRRAEEAAEHTAANAAPPQHPVAPPRTWKKSNDGANDPDWIPGLTKLKPQKRYTATKPLRETVAKQPNLHNNVPGEIALPTPFINRTLRNVEESPHCLSPRQLAVYNGRGREPTALRPQNPIENLDNGDLRTIYTGIVGGLAKVLEATKKISPSSSSEQQGTRTLLSACLRQVPEYIELEAHWQKEEEGAEDDNDREDVQGRVYDELEQLGSCAGQGWHHLGEVVRAHAVHMITSGLKDGTVHVDRDLWRGFISVCYHHEAWDACQDIISLWSCMTRSALPVPSSPSDVFFDIRRNDPIGELYRTTKRSKSWVFFFRQLGYLIRSEIVPIEWMSVIDMQPLWEHVWKSFRKDSSSIAAMIDFLQAYALRSTGLCADTSIFYYSPPRNILDNDVESLPASPKMRNAATKTVESIWTILAALAITLGNDSRGTITLLFDALKTCSLSVREELSRQLQNLRSNETPSILAARSQRASMILGAPIILHLYEVAQSIPDPLSLDSPQRYIHATRRACKPFDRKWRLLKTEALAKMTTEIANLAGRISRREKFEYIRHLTTALAGAPGTVDSKGADFLKRWSFDAAMLFADKTGSKLHLEFAKTLQPGFLSADTQSGDDDGTSDTHKSVKSHDDVSDFTSNILQSYRWEEGIEEFISRTPANARKRLRGLAGEDEEKVAFKGLRRGSRASLSSEISFSDGNAESELNHRASPEVVIISTNTAADVTVELDRLSTTSTRSSSPELEQLDSSPLSQRAPAEDSFTSVSTAPDLATTDATKPLRNTSKRTSQAQADAAWFSFGTRLNRRQMKRRCVTLPPARDRDNYVQAEDIANHDDDNDSHNADYVLKRTPIIYSGPLGHFTDAHEGFDRGHAVGPGGSTRFARLTRPQHRLNDSAMMNAEDEDGLRLKPFRHRRTAELQGLRSRPQRKRSLRSESARSSSSRHSNSSTRWSDGCEDELNLA